MINRLSRTEMLFGKEAMEILKNSKVAVFGIGGVGGHTAEALVRSGVGTVDIIDNDTVSITNVNRQIFATSENVGEYKVDVAKKRLAEISPETVINGHKCFFMPDTADEFDFTQYDYIVDAIDTVTGKIALVLKANESNVPIISSMGTGNKLDPTAFKVADIFKTKVCPLARVMRYELKKRGIKKLKVVYSEEEPKKPLTQCEEETAKKEPPGSNAFVPPVAGLIIAGEVVKDLIKKSCG